MIHGAAEVDPPFDALVVDSSFAAATELTDSILRPLPALIRPCLTGPGVPLASLHAGCWLPDIRPEDRISAVRAPLLIVHCQDDFLIPADHARRLFANAHEPKELLLVESGNHGTALFVAEDRYREALGRLVSHPRNLARLP